MAAEAGKTGEEVSPLLGHRIRLGKKVLVQLFYVFGVGAGQVPSAPEHFHLILLHSPTSALSQAILLLYPPTSLRSCDKETQYAFSQ
jgi:hypothetical protein